MSKEFSAVVSSEAIISEVRRRPCLYDSALGEYADRQAKCKSWDEVCSAVVPDWERLPNEERAVLGKDVQKRWRSIRDSFMKAYRQGKCAPPGKLPANAKRYLYHKQMLFMIPTLGQRKSKCKGVRKTTAKIKIKKEEPPPPEVAVEAAPIEARTPRAEPAQPPEDRAPPPDTKPPLVAGLEDRPFEEEDRMFMLSLLPCFKKMNDDTKLACRIEILQSIRRALQSLLAIRHSVDNDLCCLSMIEKSMETVSSSQALPDQSSFKVTSTPSATAEEGDRGAVRNRRVKCEVTTKRQAVKRRPGRPRKKVVVEEEDGDESPEEFVRPARRRRASPDLDHEIGMATTLTDLKPPQFLKVYNLEPANHRKKLENSSKLESTNDSILFKDGA